jgi:hypothetical protein
MNRSDWRLPTVQAIADHSLAGAASSIPSSQPVAPLTKHCSQRPGRLEGVPCATPHRLHSFVDIGMLQRLHRHFLQIASVSTDLRGLTRTLAPQMEQADVRSGVGPEIVWTSFIGSSRPTRLRVNDSSLKVAAIVGMPALAGF